MSTLLSSMPPQPRAGAAFSEFTKQWLANRPKIYDPSKHRRILCFGDSLTAGYQLMGHLFTPYAAFLEKMLREKYSTASSTKKDFCVDHVGLSGWTVVDMANSLTNTTAVDCVDRDWCGGLSSYLNAAAEHSPVKYDIVVILGGTNDLGEILSKNCSIEQFLTSLRQLYVAAKQAGCKVIAIPVPEHGQETEFPRVKQLRNQINQYIQQLESTGLVDAVVSLDDGFEHNTAAGRAKMDDALHWNESGYEALAERVFRAVTEVVQKE